MSSVHYSLPEKKYSFDEQGGTEVGMDLQGGTGSSLDIRKLAIPLWEGWEGYAPLAPSSKSNMGFQLSDRGLIFAIYVCMYDYSFEIKLLVEGQPWNQALKISGAGCIK